tara:strand:- start:333 stop:443 length:111 start_codon:yes stop_codon:yes gene_type:complete
MKEKDLIVKEKIVWGLLRKKRLVKDQLSFAIVVKIN